MDLVLAPGGAQPAPVVDHLQGFGFAMGPFRMYDVVGIDLEWRARELAGQPDLLFRRNSQTGAVECKTNKTAIELNEALHAHN